LSLSCCASTVYGVSIGDRIEEFTRFDFVYLTVSLKQFTVAQSAIFRLVNKMLFCLCQIPKISKHASNGKMDVVYNILAMRAFLALLAISFCSSSRNRFLMASDRLSSLS
jgi:hypothetical protein